MFKKLTNLVNEGINNITNSFSKFTNKEFLQCSIAGTVLVAYADGVVSPEEKNKIFSFCKQNDYLKVYDTEVLTEYYNTYAKLMDFDLSVGKMDLLNKISSFSKDMELEQRKLILSVCVAVAKADNGIDETERKCLIEVRNALRIEPNEFSI